MARVSNHTTSGYEKQDVSAWKVGLVGFASLLLLVLAIVVINQIFSLTRLSLYYETVLRPESKALREQRSREEEMLNSYGVIDVKAGIYRIPIVRAMKLLADEAYHAERK